MSRPEILLFDVNETLSDMSPMADAFEHVGAKRELAQSWFAAVLRDGFALTVSGECAPFAEIAQEQLRHAFAKTSLTMSLEDAVEHVMGGFAELGVHPDVRNGLPRLAAQGQRMATLSNGSASVARTLLDRAGLAAHVEATLTVEDAGVWKPGEGAYAHGVTRSGVQPGEAMLVAVHPWDIDGAARAGLATCWIDRTGNKYPSYFKAPDLTATGLDDLATQLG